MAYSIGNKELPVLQDNTSSTIGAMGDAFKAINGSFDKLANLPWLARGLVQENADARYSAALNKYSNDPDGLAKALANGNIDTSNVTANTLNQTQDRLKDIGNNYSRSYLQGRTENLNKYLEGQGGKDYLTAVSLAQQGKNIDNLRNNANAPAEAISLWDKLDPVTQQNIARQQALSGAGLGFAQQKYNDELNANSALFKITQFLAGNFKDPDSFGKATTDVLRTGKTEINGQIVDFTPYIQGTLRNNATTNKLYDLFHVVPSNLEGSGSPVMTGTALTAVDPTTSTNTDAYKGYRNTSNKSENSGVIK